MPDSFEEVSVRLVNQKVQFTGVSKANPDQPIRLDYRPPLGDGQGYNGLELLLMSFCGCSGTAMVYLLRNMGKTIDSFETRAEGLRREKPPLKFENIHVTYIVTSPDITEQDMQKALVQTEESFCPVWNMVKNNVVIEPDFQILS